MPTIDPERLLTDLRTLRNIGALGRGGGPRRDDRRRGKRIRPLAPTRMDEGLRQHIAAAAERHAPGKWQRMPSGAFHDAGIVSACIPSAMLCAGAHQGSPCCSCGM